MQMDENKSKTILNRSMDKEEYCIISIMVIIEVFFYGWWEMIESQHGSGGGRVSGIRAAVLHIGKACTS